MSNTKRLLGMLAATSMMYDNVYVGGSRMRRFSSPENGNSRRTHKENIRRRRLRKMVKKSKQLNYKK